MSDADRERKKEYMKIIPTKEKICYIIQLMVWKN